MLLVVTFAERAIRTATVNISCCLMLFWQTWKQALPLSCLCVLQHTWGEKKSSIHTNLNIWIYSLQLNPPPDDRATLKDFANLLIVLWINWNEGIKDNSDWWTETGRDEEEDRKREAEEEQGRGAGKGQGAGREVKAGYKWRRRRVWGEEMKDGEKEKREKGSRRSHLERPGREMDLVNEERRWKGR